MKYHTKDDFIKLARVSCSTIDRFYRQYPKIGDERKEVGKRKDIPESHLKYFDMNLMIKTDQEKDKKIGSLQKVIYLARNKESLAAKLWHMDWMFFGTVSYWSDYTRNTCYNKMNLMFNQLKKQLDDTDLRLFFTTESYQVRGGNHNHFVLNCSSQYRDQILYLINENFKRDRIDLQVYNPEEAGIFYITKDGLQGTDWDYLT